MSDWNSHLFLFAFSSMALFQSSGRRLALSVWGHGRLVPTAGVEPCGCGPACPVETPAAGLAAPTPCWALCTWEAWAATPWPVHSCCGRPESAQKTSPWASSACRPANPLGALPGAEARTWGRQFSRNSLGWGGQSPAALSSCGHSLLRPERMEAPGPGCAGPQGHPAPSRPRAGPNSPRAQSPPVSLGCLRVSQLPARWTYPIRRVLALPSQSPRFPSLWGGGGGMDL